MKRVWEYAAAVVMLALFRSLASIPSGDLEPTSAESTSGDVAFRHPSGRLSEGVLGVHAGLVNGRAEASARARDWLLAARRRSSARGHERRKRPRARLSRPASRSPARPASAR